MANILEELGKGMWDSIKSPYQAVEAAVKGDFGDAWDKLKAIPGNQERHNSEILNAAGIRGWVGDHPGESAAAVVGTILGGSALVGAMGGAGSSAGAAVGGGAPVSSAVGMTPAEAIVAGGGSASEVGSVSTAGAYSRFGNVLNQFGGQMMNNSSAQTPQAPAFKPQYKPQQQQGYGQAAMSQMSNDYML